jgi:hypothetical protein
LRDKLNEELYEHTWRFDPFGEGDVCAPAMCSNKPILAKDMYDVKGVYQTGADAGNTPQEPYRVQEGSEFIFFYDEGSPTQLIVSINHISPLPMDKAIEDYPCRIDVEAAAVQAAKRQRIAAAPVLTIIMDEAYPNLKHRLLQEDRISVLFGNGCEPKGDSPHEQTPFCVIWGGPAYTRS